MSAPIDDCLVHKAALGDEKAKDELLVMLRMNLRLGHWSHFPCPHKPQCAEATVEQYNTFWQGVWQVLNSEPCHMCNGTKLAPGEYYFDPVNGSFGNRQIACPACSEA